MKTQITLIIAFLLICISGCKKEDKTDDTFNSDSYLPMKIGNYWKINSDNYTEITDTIRINGFLFYKFYSIIGGDGRDTHYLRIDENNDLIEKIPDRPDMRFTHAKFNSKIGDKFHFEDTAPFYYLVSVIYKRHDIIKFEFKWISDPRLAGSYTKTYKKGMGFIGIWKEIRINETTYKF